ncbi:transcriptional regulator [Thermus composti]|uniref:Response regulator n=1 Tax=Thermus composti TaxID=532059 RepID=A0ABV6PZM3_9DEIN|nr:response regulator [Thermus composti]GGM91500.1 transcriptional regulator [Thermus composti]
MAEPFPGLLLLTRNEALRAYVDLVLSEQKLSFRHFDLAREGLFWLKDHTPRYILLDTDLDLDPFAVAARIRHVRRLKEVPLAVLIPPSERLRATAEVVRVVAIEKPLSREKLFHFLGLSSALG